VRTADSIRLGSLDDEAQAAIRAISDAMLVARSLDGRVTASAKPDTSPVTVADLAIQALIASRLGDDFPNDPLIAEEDASVMRAEPDDVLSSRVVDAVRRVVRDATREQVLTWIERGASGIASRFWVLDPVDGTKGFLAGRQYAIALALIVDGVVRLGVIGCPRLLLEPPEATVQIERSHGGIAIAVRGSGAWWNAGQDTCRRIEVSACRDASAARVREAAVHGRT
jgi:3'(2'), 5'-bisphosphate nucleotidase